MIIAQQTNRTNKNVIIPTPENAIVVGEYDEVTPRMDRAPPIYIRVPGEFMRREGFFSCTTMQNCYNKNKVVPKMLLEAVVATS